MNYVKFRRNPRQEAVDNFVELIIKLKKVIHNSFTNPFIRSLVLYEFGL